jgi:hypothetical protein
MKKIFTILLFLILSLGISKTSFSINQNIKGGDITYTYIPNTNGLSYEFSVLILKDSIGFVSRPFIFFNGGDNSTDTLYRLWQITNAGIVYSLYNGIHTFPGPGTYLCSAKDSFLVSNISNINNSGNEKLNLECIIDVSSFLVPIDTFIFQNPQADSFNCSGNWFYNPGAYESSGDSLSYALVSFNTNNYTFPPATINAVTGDLTMSPISNGNYAVAIQVSAWRNGIIIGNILRMMLVNVSCLTGINELSNPMNLYVYPNAASSTITLNNLRFGIYYLRITDVLGNEIYHQPINNSNNQTIDISQWSNGVYFYQIKNDKEALRGKFVVEK